MSPSILLSLLFISLCVSSTFGRRQFIPPLYNEKKHSTPLARELIEEGYLRPSVVEGGYPRVTCLSRKLNQEPFLDECEMSFRMRGAVACFSVWDNEGGRLQQGCMRGQDISLLAQCTKTACKVPPNYDYPHGMNFCCCFGDECNAIYSN